MLIVLGILNPGILRVKDDVFSSECGECNAGTLFLIKYTHKTEEYHDGAEVDFLEEFHFCICSICQKFFIIISEHELYVHDYGFVLEYPIDKRFIDFKLPDLVKVSYLEAVKCEKAGAYLATAVMVGRSLEAIVKENTQSNSIYEGLTKLKEDGLISEEIHDWSNELRLIRNIGAHAEEKMVTKVDAEEALDFLQAILEILYHLRPKFLAFRKRRQDQANSS